jgi:hypothetical protein
MMKLYRYLPVPIEMITELVFFIKTISQNCKKIPVQINRKLELIVLNFYSSKISYANILSLLNADLKIVVVFGCISRP